MVVGDRERYAEVYEAEGDDLKRFTWEAQAARLLALYRDVMHG